MAYDAFLKLDGIDGEVTAEGYEKWIEVLSFSWGESNAGSYASGGGGGKVSFQDLHFTHQFDKSSPPMMAACAKGQPIASAFLKIRESPTTANVDNVFLKYEIENVFVSSIQAAGAEQGDDRPAEEVSLNFQKVYVSYQAPGDDSPVEFRWNLATGGTS